MSLAFEANPGGAGPAQSWLRNLDGGATIQHQRVFDVWGRLVRHSLGGAVRYLAYDAAGRITIGLWFRIGKKGLRLALRDPEK